MRMISEPGDTGVELAGDFYIQERYTLEKATYSSCAQVYCCMLDSCWAMSQASWRKDCMGGGGSSSGSWPICLSRYICPVLVMSPTMEPLKDRSCGSSAHQAQDRQRGKGRLLLVYLLKDGRVAVGSRLLRSRLCRQ
jgi:hypothetical protein